MSELAASRDDQSPSGGRPGGAAGVASQARRTRGGRRRRRWRRRRRGLARCPEGKAVGCRRGKRFSSAASILFPCGPVRAPPSSRSSSPSSPRKGLRPPKCRLGERSVAPRSRNEPLGRSSSLPGPCRGCGSGGRGERERDGVGDAAVGRQRGREGGRGAGLAPGLPPARAAVCGWVPRRYRAVLPRVRGASAGDGGRPYPPSSDPLCRRPPGGVKGAVASLSLPAEAVACRPAGRSPVRAVSAALSSSVLVPGMGVFRLRRLALLFPPLARGREGGGEGRAAERSLCRPAVRPAAQLWACDLRSDVATR
ncbi:serine/arginine repetitive matrix protein 3-like [Catharus ustulatus]|uniref:serine/arginine repetitive matrix protein 3-like n=1 Tax=Catharus ustulatus TaxID=91951 RepID=UPI001C5B5BA7|nr:serine/arginine repetitive matrix protein 3-like [Catharus ustulatus]